MRATTAAPARASRTPSRTRIELHEWVLAALAFVMPLGPGTKPAFLGSSTLTLGFAALAAYLLWSLVLLSGGRLPRHARSLLVPLVLYVVVTGAASLRFHLPGVRYEMFALMALAVAAYLICERHRPGSWLRITYRASVAGLVLAVVEGHRTVADTGVNRLTGTNSAIFLGFQASLVLIVAYMHVRGTGGRGRLWPLLAMALGAYVLVESFSRTALISTALAAAVIFFFSGRQSRLVRGLVLAAMLLVVMLVAVPVVIRYLGANHSETVFEASGRVNIWPRLLHHDTEPWAGYGFGTLHDSLGPDQRLLYLNGGLQSENAALQAFLMGGFLAAALWLWVAVRVLRSLWSVRSRAGGVALGVAVVIALNAMASSALSGIAVDFWWLLAAASLADGVRARRRAGAAALHPPKERVRQPAREPVYRRSRLPI